MSYDPNTPDNRPPLGTPTQSAPNHTQHAPTGTDPEQVRASQTARRVEPVATSGSKRPLVIAVALAILVVLAIFILVPAMNEPVYEEDATGQAQVVEESDVVNPDAAFAPPAPDGVAPLNGTSEQPMPGAMATPMTDGVSVEPAETPSLQETPTAPLTGGPIDEEG